MDVPVPQSLRELIGFVEDALTVPMGLLYATMPACWFGLKKEGSPISLVAVEITRRAGCIGPK